MYIVLDICISPSVHLFIDCYRKGNHSRKDEDTYVMI